jgi:hypothetical protein
MQDLRVANRKLAAELEQERSEHDQVRNPSWIAELGLFSEPHKKTR